MDELDKIRKKKREGMQRNTSVERTDTPIVATDANVDDLISSHRVLLVDFWAEWCGPCRMVAPIVDELARGHAGRLAVAKLNVDQNPRTAMRFGVMGIPTLILFKEGKVAEKMVGAMPKGMIEENLKRHMQ